MRSAALARAAVALEVDGPPQEIEVDDDDDLDEDEAAVKRMRTVTKGPSDDAQAKFVPLGASEWGWSSG